VSIRLTPEELRWVSSLLQQAGVLPERELVSELIAGGRSNLTFRITDGSTQWVLRMPPRFGRTPSAHDVAREYRVTDALASVDFPVPRPVLLHEGQGSLEGPFVVYEFVDGQAVRSVEDLDAISDEALDSTVDALMHTFARLHQIEFDAVGLSGLGRPVGYVERQVARWSSQWEIVAPPTASIDRAGRMLSSRLLAAVPNQTSVSIVHGDYRLDNTIVDLTSGKSRVAAVVDWELSTLGDPVADVAMMCAYRHGALDLVLGFPAAWTSSRLPDVPELLERYTRAGGAELVDWDFHLALAYYKVAVIAAGIRHRHIAAGGNPEKDLAGQAVEPFLEAGLALALRG